MSIFTADVYIFQPSTALVSRLSFLEYCLIENPYYICLIEVFFTICFIDFELALLDYFAASNSNTCASGSSILSRFMIHKDFPLNSGGFMWILIASISFSMSELFLFKFSIFSLALDTLAAVSIPNN